MTEFIARLKQRKLVQWALAYLAAGWAALQALGLVADSYDWPHRVMQIAFAAIALGYVDVTQTKTAALPTISVQGGSAPAFNVQTANVSVGTENHVVQTPTVNVQKPQ